jgi:hypothetical protein
VPRVERIPQTRIALIKNANRLITQCRWLRTRRRCYDVNQSSISDTLPVMKSKFSYLLPSIADIIFMSVLFTIVTRTENALLGDGDTGYHIRTGELILNSLSIPKYDIFSFLSPPLPWIAHEWLSEVLMAAVHGTFGLSGVVLIFSLTISSIYFCLFKLLQNQSKNIILVAVIVLLAAISSSLHWLARPHVFSLLLTVLWYKLLDDYQYQGQNRLYFLLPMTLLWVNLHGGFIVGLMLVAFYLAGNVIESVQIYIQRGKPEWSKCKVLAATGIFCLFISLLNPHGYHILFFPFKLTGDTFIMDHVQEFLSPNFHQPLPYKYLLLFLIGTLAVSKLTVNFIELTLILIFTYMSLYSARYIPLFAIITAPILVRLIDTTLANSKGTLLNVFTRKSHEIGTTDAATRGFLWPIACSLAVILIAAGGILHFRFDETKFPVAAVSFLKTENIHGNMFNNDEFGDYIIYAAWPKYKVFSDGRSDMYGAARGKEYFKVAYVEPGWEEVLQKYDVSWIIFGTSTALSEILRTKDEWHLVYADGTANIFVKDDGKNQDLISKYPRVEPVFRAKDPTLSQELSKYKL